MEENQHVMWSLDDMHKSCGQDHKRLDDRVFILQLENFQIFIYNSLLFDVVYVPCYQQEEERFFPGKKEVDIAWLPLGGGVALCVYFLERYFQ